MGLETLEGKKFFTYETICSGIPLMIDDLCLNASETWELEACAARLVKASCMSQRLLSRLLYYEYDPPTIVLYVGRSGQIVRSFLGSSDLLGEEVNVHAVSWDRGGSQPLVTTGPIDREPFIDTYIGQVLVIDDVISTGTTLELLCARNAWRFPKAFWSAGVWVTRKKKLDGYKMIDSTLLVTHPKGKRVPIVSLSTLCAQTEIARSFAEKHFFDRDGKKLLSLLAGIHERKRCPA
jgi:hypothetical protein